MEKRMMVKNEGQMIFFVFAGLQREENQEGGKNFNFQLLRDALKVFVLSKAQMSSFHKFSIVKSLKINEGTSDIDQLRSEIDSLDVDRFGSCESIISKILESRSPNETMIYQFIIIFGDAEIEGLLENLNQLPDVFIDFVSIGKENKNTENLHIFHSHLIQESSKKSLFFKVKNSFDLFRAMSLLTAHPQQRVSQDFLTSLN
jgi:hypothetical protein